MEFHKKRIIGDLTLVILALSPAITGFILDIKCITDDLFLRTGAIMVLFSAFLEFRTHEVQMLRIKDGLNALWRMSGVLVEAHVQTDSAVKWVLRQMSTIIMSAGMEPDIGRPEDIKDIELTEKQKSLKYIPDTPESYYKYNSFISLLGKIFVILGTIIWAFGDLIVKHYIAEQVN